MAGFFLKIGLVNKKIIMIVIASLLYIIMDIIEYYSGMCDLHIILDTYTRGISYTAIIIVPIILNRLDKNKKETKEKSECSKKCILHFSLLYLVYIGIIGSTLYINSLKSKEPENTEDFQVSHYSGICSEEALEIVFIVIISKFLLKMRLYIHHYIGLITFTILSFAIDICFNLSLFKPGYFFVIIYSIELFFDALFITYEKYMMDKLYYSPYVGLFFLVACVFFTILILIKGNMLYDGKSYKLQSFSDYFDENGISGPIVHIVYLTSFRFFLNILKILTVYYFTQFHTYTAYILIKVFDLILKKENNYKYFTLLFFVFQFLGLLVFLEIIELNFFGLNKNTKKNIEMREIQENMKLMEENDKDSEVGENQNKNKIECAPGYLIETEMLNMSSDEEKKDYNRDSYN